MSINDVIAGRRAIKHFDSTYRLSDAEREQILTNASLAPSSFNIQHWRFVEITNPELRQAIRAAAWDQAPITEASALFVITADTQAWAKTPERYWRHTEAEKQNMIVDMLQGFYLDKPGLQRDEAIRSGSLAAQNMMLTARAIGLDSNPMSGFDPEAVGKLIKLPEDHVIVMLLAIGKAASAAWPRGGQLELEELVIENQFA